MPAYCEVALPVPLDHTFTYGVRVGQQPQRGARVIVPFRNEKLIGVVTALDAKAPARDRGAVSRGRARRGAAAQRHLLELAEWTAQYYLAPLGEVLRAMLPLAAEVRRTVYYRLTDLGRDVLASAMEGGSGLNRSGPGRGPPRILRLALRSTKGSLRMTNESERASFRAKRRTWSIGCLRGLASGEPVKVSTLRTATAASLPVLAGMVRKKWIARETAAAERDARRMERFAVLVPETRLPRLTEKQQAILAELAACGGELPLAELRRRESALVHAANSRPARPGAHRGAAGGVSPGRADSRSGADTA